MKLHLAIYTDHGYSEFQLRAFAALNEDSPDEGRFVSPREEFVIETSAVGNGGELYQYGGRGNYPMLLLGCVTYHVIQDSDAPKQTGFAYRFEAIDDDLRIFPSQGDLKADQVRLVPAGGGFVT
jgi:hypothetical protein